AIFDARMKDGKRCSGSIPYGYNRVKDDKQSIVVDPEAAEVVRHIFQLANEGKSPRAIAEILSAEKVLIPSAYEKENHPEQYNGQQFEDPYIWSVSIVRTILNRQEYIGHTVLHKSTVKDFKNHKRQETGADEHYVFPKDRKSTRLNSSHVSISYAVFCLKKKKKNKYTRDKI